MADRTEYQIVDESEVPPYRAGVGRWKELYEILATLPVGKWVRIPIAEGEIASTTGTNLLQSARSGRKPYKLKTRSCVKRRELFVTVIERYEVKEGI